MKTFSVCGFWFLQGLCLSPAEVRLVGGSSPCSGRLEQQRQSDWEPVRDQNWDWNLTAADQVCRRISCGSVVSLRRTLDQEPPTDVVTKYDFRAEVTLVSSFRVEITCSDSVRLENETHLCSGRLQVKWNQVWSSVCSDGFDLQDAEVVCRELGCGSPSGFEGELYGEAPEWSTEFLCGGHESGLLHCDHSDRDTCSPGTTITLTCSVRLVEGSGRCDGTLELRNWGEWRPVDEPYGDLRWASMVCDELDCGSPLETGGLFPPGWGEVLDVISPNIEPSDLLSPPADSVRLENRFNLCSGRLQVKWNQVWSSVCSDGFDLQDAEVVCRELGCGSPSGFKGELYGEAPEWNTEFLCGGHESGLLHCDHSDRDTCSPDPDDVRLVGGASRCAGRLEMKHDGVWRAMKIQNPDWNLNVAAVICGRLDCGPAVSAVNRPKYPQEDVSLWSRISSLDVIFPNIEPSDLLSPPADSVRLMGGTHLCSGRLQVKWNQVWSSVCSDGFDLQDAEVVCRELGCGSPSGFKGELYGEAPEWSTEFLCGGHESGLLHCDHSDRDTCSPGTTITLTCSGKAAAGKRWNILSVKTGTGWRRKIRGNGMEEEDPRERDGGGGSEGTGWRRRIRGNGMEEEDLRERDGGGSEGTGWRRRIRGNGMEEEDLRERDGGGSEGTGWRRRIRGNGMEEEDLRERDGGGSEGTGWRRKIRGNGMEEEDPRERDGGGGSEGTGWRRIRGNGMEEEELRERDGVLTEMRLERYEGVR
uniref:SRCR domain-containing protein n=1 Tax=Amphiprion percula TaxID=161767 RepID=A0A3P8U3X8_AMPPE